MGIGAAKLAVSNSPSLISAIISHYLNGPPQPSWDLKFHLLCVFFGSMIIGSDDITIEQLQAGSFLSISVTAGMVVNETKIDNKYRYEAQVHLEKILKPYEHVLDAEWKDLKEDGIAAEWVQASNDGWDKRETRKTVLYLHGGVYCLCSKGSYRDITSKFAKNANARVFAINYRLAPQNEFPAGLHDALAAYLYLLNPPKDAGFEPLNPKNIVIAGDSAGGGLSMALGLAIRDSGLPSCAGIIGLSPWVDLTISMPSMLEDKCDYIAHPGIRFRHRKSQAMIKLREKAGALTTKIKKQNLGPKIWHDSFERLNERIQLYAPNEGLAIPYVSPMLAESLGDLPPLLLIAGDEERLRDEIVYFAYKASEPSKYKGPSYNDGKFGKTPFQTPTNVTLEVYQEMPHVFQIFYHPSAVLSYKRSAEFINRVIDTPNELLPSSYNIISSKGELSPLNENHKEILNWKNVGIVPDTIKRFEDIVISHSLLTPELLVYIVLLLGIISYFM